MEILKNQNIIDQFLIIEWEMMQSTNNLGGRASCQDDLDTFYIMRASQYANWTEEMLLIWLDFVKKSKAEGRNLVAEKYGRMMQYTDLHYFNKHIKPRIPFVPVKNYRYINTIVDALINWEKEFAQLYPKLSMAGRPITSEGDASGFTSMETYARGELETYPEELLILYADYITELKNHGQSLVMKNQLTMVQLYGYDSMEDAEASL